MTAVIYTRVSTTEQVDNLSLDLQERECRSYCERNGLPVDRVFREEGQSAKTTARTELRELLAYCAREAKQRHITVLVVYKVDRLARQVEDHMVLKATLLQYGIKVRAVAESFDDSPFGNFFETLMAAHAQLDNELRRDRTIDGMRERLRRGRWAWRAPLGYTQGDSESEVSMTQDSDRAPLLRHGFEAIASRRLTKAEALAELTDLGLRTKKGDPVPAQTWGKTLRNPLYAGRIVKPEWDIDVEGDWEPIVDRGTFDAVQAVLDGRAVGKTSRVRNNPDFPLRRIVKCGACSAPLTGSWSRGRSQRYAYYHCPTKGCGGVSVRRERLESALVEALGDMSLRPELLELLSAVVKDAWEERLRVSREAESALEDRLAGIEQRQAKLTEALLDGRVKQQTFDKQEQRLADDETEVRNRLASVTTPEASLSRAIDLAQAMLLDLPRCWETLEPTHRAEFVAALYPKGLVFRAGSIGTVEVPWWMAGSGATEAQDERLAPHTGFEPVLPA